MEQWPSPRLRGRWVICCLDIHWQPTSRADRPTRFTSPYSISLSSASFLRRLHLVTVRATWTRIHARKAENSDEHSPEESGLPMIACAKRNPAQVACMDQCGLDLRYQLIGKDILDSWFKPRSDHAWRDEDVVPDRLDSREPSESTHAKALRNRAPP